MTPTDKGIGFCPSYTTDIHFSETVDSFDWAEAGQDWIADFNLLSSYSGVTTNVVYSATFSSGTKITLPFDIYFCHIPEFADPIITASPKVK